MRRLLALLAFWAVTEPSEANGTELLKHLRFHSTNFENILVWERGKNTTPDTVFSVAYSIYGAKRWQEKGACQNMTSRSCDLTGETGNIHEYYYAQVTALTESGLSASFRTQRFNPKTETVLKPPDVTFDPGVHSIRFILGPSLTLARDASGSPLALEDIFPNLLYHLRINVNQTHHMIKEGKEKEYEFPGLAPDTEYSGTVGIRIPSLAKHSPTHKFSVRTLPDRTWTYYFSGMSLFTMGFLVAVACFMTYKYINKNMQQPRVLDLQRVLTYHPLKFTREHVLTPVCDLVPPAAPPPPRAAPRPEGGLRDAPGFAQMPGDRLRREGPRPRRPGPCTEGPGPPALHLTALSAAHSASTFLRGVPDGRRVWRPGIASPPETEPGPTRPPAPGPGSGGRVVPQIQPGEAIGRARGRPSAPGRPADVPAGPGLALPGPGPAERLAGGQPAPAPPAVDPGRGWGARAGGPGLPPAPGPQPGLPPLVRSSGRRPRSGRARAGALASAQLPGGSPR
ncbi:interleukin-22 receptor subunit alpha-1 isoform X2 [Ornithorhynchus anatinus]|uniref:interleukin-22 receptor subunit alpha-1 isoform X2 n=1 Tax=Ornithorhynchus anatinus TaxID=9258 RepID=UPI0010A7ED25|nr:interleukin-22 receptor subunit alpha-1 isoform X2 [Ornithorhynchus anatinus]